MSDSQNATVNISQEAKSDTSVSTPLNVTETSNADFVTPKSAGEPPIRVPGRKKVIRVSKPKLLKNRYPLRDLEKIHRRSGEHPSYKQMIDEAIFKLDSRKGVSRAAIKNYIAKKYPVGDRNGAINSFIRKAIKKLVEQNVLILVEGATQKSARYRLAPEVKQQMKKVESKTIPTSPKPKSEEAKKAGEAKEKRKASTAAKIKGVGGKKKTGVSKKKVMTRKPAQEKTNVLAKPKVKKSAKKKTPKAAIKKSQPAAASEKSAKTDKA